MINLRFLLLISFLFCLNALTGQNDTTQSAPLCNEQTVLGTCRDNHLADGRHYVFDSTGKLIEIRLFLNGRYVDNAMIEDSTMTRSPVMRDRPQDSTKLNKPKVVHYTVDSVQSTVDCTAYASQPDSSQHTANRFNGEGFWITYRNGKIHQKGYFREATVFCGVEYVYSKKGKLRCIKVYQDGKLVNKVKVPS